MLELVASCLQPAPLLLIIPVCATSLSIFTLKRPNSYPQYLQFSPLPVGFSRPLSESCGLSLELTFLLLELGVLLLKLTFLLLEQGILLLDLDVLNFHLCLQTSLVLLTVRKNKTCIIRIYDVKVHAMAVFTYPQCLQLSLLPPKFSIFLLQLDIFSLCLPSLIQLHNKNK